MPAFTFTSPEGKSYTVNGPEGATKEQAFSILQQQLSHTTAAQAPDESDPSHAGKYQGQRIAADAADYVSDLQNNPVGGTLRTYAAPIEAAANMGSGILSPAVGGLAALGSIAKSGIENQVRNGLHIPTSDEFDAAANKAADTARAVQQAATYQPRTAGGKLLSEVASVPLNAASEMTRSVGGDVGQVVGGDNGRIAGEEIGSTLPAIAATLQGGYSALKKPGSSIGVNKEPLPPIAAEVDDAGAPVSAANPATPTPTSATPTQEATPALYNLQRQTESGQLPPEEQAARAQVLQRIGLDDARQSAITGNAAEGAVQAQVAKFLDDPTGRAAKELFDNERSALQNHAQSIIADTGGSVGSDASTLNSRGQVIAAPFDSLRQYFDTQIKNLYAKADEASGGVPETNLSNLEDFLGTKSNFAGKAENSSLGKGLSHYLREQGIMDADGSLLPVTAKQAEGIKQYINSQWSPSTSGLAGKIKGIIDDDVFQGAGGDIYAQARNMYKMQKATLDNPSGIAKILDYDPQTPINRATPFEKIPDTLTNLPVSQFGHVIDVLNKILDPQYKTPELLQLQAMDAINEIKAHMANNLQETGSKFQSKWNAPGVTQYLKQNAPKLQMVFDNATLKKIADLNDAGHILSVDKSYLGAASQAQIALKRGLLPNIVSKSAAGIGGLTGSFAGPVGATAGAAVGSTAGDSLAASMSGNAALKRFNQGIVHLNDYLNPAEQAPVMKDMGPAVTVPLSALTAVAPIAAKSGVAAEIEAYKERQRQRKLQEAALAAEAARIKEMQHQQAIKDIGRAQTVDQAIEAFTNSTK